MNEELGTINQDPQDPIRSDPLSETGQTDAAKGTRSANSASAEGEKAAARRPPCEPTSNPLELPADPVQDPDSDPAADIESDPSDAMEQLRAELTHLRSELAKKDRYWQRIGGEYEEFHTLYPDVSIASLPDGVWEAVERGVPIAAAYALAEKKRLYTEEAAAKQNADNKARTSGALESPETDFYSPAEVRAMKPAEVRKNIEKIRRSMKSWH